MRIILASTLVLALAGPAVTGPALADEPPPPPEVPKETTPPGERVVLPAKRLYAQAAFEIDLSADTAFDPVSLTPDLFYGVNSSLTVGLVHSGRAGGGFIATTGSSLCFTSKCDVYNGVGLDGRYQLVTGKVGAAANFGLYANNLDPFELSLKLGAIGRFRPSPASKLAVDFAPALSIGITGREPAVMGGVGNKEVFALPVTVLYAAAPRVTALVQTGIFVPFAAAGEAYAVPLSLGGSYAVNKQLSVEAAFSFKALLGGSAVASGADGRSFTLGGGYAF